MSMHAPSELRRLKCCIATPSCTLASLPAEVYREHTRPFEFIDHSNASGAVAIWTRDAPGKLRTKK